MDEKFSTKLEKGGRQRDSVSNLISNMENGMI
jgi:hypothetical protein